MSLSTSAQETIAFMRNEHMKDAFGDLRVFQGHLDEAAKTTAADCVVPLEYLEGCNVEELTGERGTRCVLVGPADGALRSDRLIIYYHGGGFVMEIDAPHWEFIAALVGRLGCRVLAPLYETLPAFGWKEAYRAIEDAYQIAGTLADYRDVVSMGDSAGGCLALATQHLAAARGWELPGRVVALSPMTDIANEIPLEEKTALDDVDPLIGMVGVVEVGKMWAPEAQDAPAFPPCILHGPFENLAPTLVITGGNEVLLQDSKVWVEKARAAGTPVEFIIGEGLWHIYPTFLNVDEAQLAFDEIIEFIR